jgi:hypothetical protein
MEQTEIKPSVSSVGLRFGLIFCLISILFTVMVQVLDVPMAARNATNLVLAVVFIVTIVLAHKHYKDRGDGFMSYGQGFGIGAIISILGSVVSAIFIYVYFSYLDPDIMSQVMDESREQWEAQGMTDEQMEMAEGFVSPGFISTMVFLMYCIGGIIISLLVPIFTQKNSPDTAI